MSLLRRREYAAARARGLGPIDAEEIQRRAAMAITRHDALERARGLASRLDSYREDRWVNYQTGLGTLEDKTRAAFFDAPLRLNDQEITNLMGGNDLAAKCVEKRPAEMFRRGYKLEATQAGKSDKSKIDATTEYAAKLFADDRMQSGMTFGRQYGGALAVLGIDDGRNPWEPVDETNIKSVRFVNIVDRRFAYAQDYYSDFLRPRHGDVRTYLVSNGIANSSWRSQDGSNFGIKKKSPERLKARGFGTQIIHESRLIRFDGVMPDPLTRQQLAGWSWSVLQRPYEILRLCDGSFDALGYLISDASQGVLKLKGLFEAISGGKEERLQQRLKMFEESRSVMRSIALDAGSGEEFTRVQTPLTGIPDSIDRIMQRLAAAMDMPVTELFGISPAGLNATGESDRIKWYDTVSTEQTKFLGPKLLRLFRLISLAQDGPFKGAGAELKVTFHPLYSPTDDELAGTRLKKAQTAQIYEDMGAVTADQVSLTITDEFPSIDADAIEEEVEGKTKFDPLENDDIESATAQQKATTDLAKQKAAAAAPPFGAKPAAATGAQAAPGTDPTGKTAAASPAAGKPKATAKKTAGAPARASKADERDELLVVVRQLATQVQALERRLADRG